MAASADASNVKERQVQMLNASVRNEPETPSPTMAGPAIRNTQLIRGALKSAVSVYSNDTEAERQIGHLLSGEDRSLSEGATAATPDQELKGTKGAEHGGCLELVIGRSGTFIDEPEPIYISAADEACLRADVDTL